MPDTPQTPTLREALLNHFSDGAPSYAMANEVVKDKARRQTYVVMKAFEQYLTDGAKSDFLNDYQNNGAKRQREAYLKGLKSE